MLCFLPLVGIYSFKTFNSNAQIICASIPVHHTGKSLANSLLATLKSSRGLGRVVNLIEFINLQLAPVPCSILKWPIVVSSLLSVQS